MVSGKLRVATCQFAVGPRIVRNGRSIREFMIDAKKAGAEVVHFSECALSGYAGTDFESFAGYDWGLLKEQTQRIMKLAGELGIWVILGSSHRLSGAHKPHNSLYLINPKGKIKDRYDKRFCTARDIEYYTPGDHFVFFSINRVKCALLICFDLRFPEIYRKLKAEGVQCVFQSFYNARQKGRSIHTDIMRQTAQARAASNYMWISMTNSSSFFSAYPSCFIRPDGTIAGQLKFHRPGFMVNMVDVNERFYDASGQYRNLAMRGILSNGSRRLKDARSKARGIL